MAESTCIVNISQRCTHWVQSSSVRGHFPLYSDCWWGLWPKKHFRFSCSFYIESSC